MSSRSRLPRGSERHSATLASERRDGSAAGGMRRPSEHPVRSLQRAIGNRATARLLQRYSSEEGWKVSANRRIMLWEDGRRILLATQDAVDEANHALERVGRGSLGDAPGGSFVELTLEGDPQQMGTQVYRQVVPRRRFTPYYSGEDFQEGDPHYHRPVFAAAEPGADDTVQAGLKALIAKADEALELELSVELDAMLTAIQADRMPTWADCSKASALVTGSNDAYHGRFAVFGRGGETVRSTGRDDPSVKYKGHANRLAHELFMVQISYFVTQPANAGHLKHGLHYMGGDADRKYVSPASLADAKRLYAGLTPEGRTAFDREARINEYASPAIGESFAMATEPEMPGFAAGGFTWNQHWAGVVMRDGADIVTLEGFALGTGMAKLLDKLQDEIVSRDWVWDMYGSVNAAREVVDPEQTFHRRHLKTGQHGSHATTMSVISTQ